MGAVVSRAALRFSLPAGGVVLLVAAVSAWLEAQRRRALGNPRQIPAGASAQLGGVAPLVLRPDEERASQEDLTVLARRLLHGSPDRAAELAECLECGISVLSLPTVRALGSVTRSERAAITARVVSFLEKLEHEDPPPWVCSDWTEVQANTVAKPVADWRKCCHAPRTIRSERLTD